MHLMWNIITKVIQRLFQYFPAGIFTGYSAMSIAMALPEDGRMVALDITDSYLQIGRPLWEEVSDVHSRYNAVQYNTV